MKTKVFFQMVTIEGKTERVNVVLWNESALTTFGHVTVARYLEQASFLLL